MKKTIKWAAIIAALSVGAVYAFGYVSDLKDQIRSQAIAIDEAIAAEEGFEAARVASAKEKRDMIAGSHLLEQQIDDLTKRLKVKPKTITIKGATIEVPVDRLIPGEIVEVPADCADCVKSYLESIPPFEFEVNALDATFESKSGAIVASGEVELWRTSPPPRTMLGVKLWEAQEVAIEKPPPEYRRLGYFFDGDLTFSPDSVSATNYDDVFVSESLSRMRLAIGAEFDVRGWAIRLGAHTDGGVRFGLSRHARVTP